MTKEIIRRETRYAVHLPKTDYREDAHYIKEQIFYKDGTQEPRTFMVKDFVRPIWVTRQAFRNHKDKKEFCSADQLYETKCTQSDSNRVVAGLLDAPYLVNQPNELKSSPYVYGYDQTSTSILKLQNLIKNDFYQSPYTNAGFDIETDVVTREILIATIVFKNQVHISVTKKYIKQMTHVYEKLMKAIEFYLPEYKDKLTVKLTIHDDEVDLLKCIFRTANEWAPDFLSIWNINFDINRILERLKLFNVNPVDVLCDQSIPRAYRLCKYKEGITKKTTASGKHKPINPSLQWHVLTCTAKFYAIDAMCVYRQIRMAKQEEPSYALDDILKKVLGEKRGKLKFSAADKYVKEKWHIFMQENYPIEYMVYNIYDCLGMLELDAVTKDLSSSFPAGAGMTDFGKFNSTPKRIVDAMFIFGMKRGEIVGTVGKINKPPEVVEGSDIPDDLLDDDPDDDSDDDETSVKTVDDYTGLGLKGWIQLLPQNQLMNEGLCVLEDFPNVVTSIRGMTWDVDATSAYPTCTIISNASKATCYNEIIDIEGVSPTVFKEQNLSVCMGGVNMLEYHATMFGLPNTDKILSMLDDM